MKRQKIKIHPTRNSDLAFDDMYYEFSHDWESKAAALQTRRWRALRRELK